MFSKIREALNGNISNITTNLIWGISLAIPFFVVWGDYAPTGWALSFIILSSLAVLFKEKKTYKILITYGSIILLSIFLILRFNPLLTFFNFWAISFLIASLTQKVDFKLNLLNVILLPFTPFFHLFGANKPIPLKLQIFKNLKIEYKSSNKSKIPWTEVLAGLGITIVVMILILPFLAMANPLFANQLISFASLFNILNWGKTLNGLFLNSFFFPRLLFFLALIFGFSKFFSYLIKANSDNEIKETTSISETINKIDLTWLLPKILTSLVLAVFISSQMELYLASKSQLAQMGYAYGVLINEIFFQLSFVAVVVFGLIYFDRSNKSNHNLFSVILLVEAFFILGVALKTNIDYIQTWGLTLRRLYGLAIYIVLVASYLWHFICRYSQKSIHHFWQGVIAVIISILIMINFINFDRVIYIYNQDLLGKVNECSYIDSLSSDAEISQETINRIQKKSMSSVGSSDTISCITSFRNIENNDLTLYLKCKNNGFDTKIKSWNNIFTFNSSKYEECKKINDRIDYVKKFNSES